MAKLGIVYKATNVLNGKGYIGVTRDNMCARIRNHKSTAGRYVSTFSHAIKKYGIENFRWEVLATSADIVELHSLEAKFIRNHGTFADTGWGYNRNHGGGGTCGMVKSAETRRRISEAMKASFVRRGHVYAPKKPKKGRVYKLSPDKVRAIRSDSRVARSLAEEHGVSLAHIQEVRRGEHWGWVK